MLAAPRDQRAADLVAVQAGQVAVEHDHVVVDDPGAPERLLAVRGDVGGDPVAAQDPGDRLGQLGVILDHQDSHRPPKDARPPVTVRSQLR